MDVGPDCWALGLRREGVGSDGVPLERARRHVAALCEQGCLQQADRLTVEGACYDVAWFPLYGDVQVRQPGEWFVASVLSPSWDQPSVAAAIRERREFEQLICHLSTHFIDLSGADIDKGIGEALRAIGEYCQVDRVYIFLFEAGGAMTNTHEWCAEGIEPQIDMLQHLPAETFPWWMERIRNNQVIHVPDVAQMPACAQAEREILQEQAICSVVVVPAAYRGKALGFVGFDSVRAHKTWRDEDIELLRLVGEMLVNAMERKRSEEERSELEWQLARSRSMENVARLAGGVAHDFNNLLAIVLNYASLLRRELEGSPHQRLASDLLDVAKDGAGLTRQLLIVGRREVVQPRVLSPNVVLKELEKLTRKTLGENIALQFELCPTLANIKMGLPQLEQVVLNLAMNARDAMPHGGRVTMATDVERVVSCTEGIGACVVPGHYVVLSVQDTGDGMSAEVAKRAFEPFFSTKGQVGTGLGLSTVHAIVQQAGGHVLLESNPGRGTCVRVYLPAVGGAPAGKGPELEMALPGRGETVLVVEDSAPLRGLICMLLEQQRYQVVAAGSPSEALEQCENHLGPIDLLLTDVIMPEMSGCRLAKALEERIGLSKVLFMSGYDDQILAAQGILPEGTMLLEKPFQETELLHAIRRALD